jgi:hypothetical protein
LTTTVADPETVPLVAWTTDVPAAESAVKRPFCVIVPRPLATDQVGVIVTWLPAPSFARAVNCSVPEMVSVSGLGETVMVAAVGTLGPTGWSAPFEQLRASAIRLAIVRNGRRRITAS